MVVVCGWKVGRSEDLDRVARDERHHGALEHRRRADRMAAAAHLGVRARRVDRTDLDVEQLLDRLADLDLVGVDRHAEVVGVAVGGVVGRLLGDHRLLDDVVEAVELLDVGGHWGSLPEDFSAEASSPALVTRPTRLPSASNAPGSQITRPPLATSKAHRSEAGRTTTPGKLRNDFQMVSSCSAITTTARRGAPRSASTLRADLAEGASPSRTDARSASTSSPSFSLP